MKSADIAYEAIRQSILDGSTAQGSRLREEEIANRLHTSRTPVREALRRLEAEGLVEVLPHRGARVTMWAAEDVTDLYDLRAVLEGMAAERAALRIDEVSLARLASLCDEMELIDRTGTLDDLRSRDRLSELNNEFHDVVRRAAGSAALLSVLQSVVQVPLVVQTFHRYAVADMRRSSNQHRDLVDALSAGDPLWATAVMQAHVLAAKATLLAASREQADADESIAEV